MQEAPVGSGVRPPQCLCVLHPPAQIGEGRIGPITAQLQALFFKVVRGDGGERSARWLTNV